MSEHDTREETRRDFLKKAGIAAGATVWTVPTMQVIRMTGANAATVGVGTVGGSVPNGTPPSSCVLTLVDKGSLCNGPLDKALSLEIVIGGGCTCALVDLYIDGVLSFGGLLPGQYSISGLDPGTDYDFYLACDGAVSNTVTSPPLDCSDPDVRVDAAIGASSNLKLIRVN